MAQNLPLVELADRLRRCQFFAGHDSGITHLAAAVGLPGLVLWGPSNEKVWRPRGEGMVLIEAGDGLSNLSASTVVEGLMDLLPTQTEGAHVE